VRVNGDIRAAPASVVSSADGKYVAFAVSDETNANQVAIADAGGGGAWKASGDLKVAFHQWSLVGSKLALMAQTQAGILSLYVVSAQDKAVRRVSEPSHAVRGFSWRPGHEMLAYTVVAHGATAATEAEPSVTFNRTLVYMADLSADEPWLVTGIANAAQLMWAPDGAHYAVTDLVEAPGGQVPTIRVGTCQGSLRVPILVRYSTGVALFNWSPDSSRISFISQNNLWCFDSGTLRTDLVANSLIVRDVSWAPDSAHVLVLAPVEQNAIGAWSVDVAAGKGRLISNGFQGGVVDWAPDAKAVMLMLTRSQASADLYLLDPAGAPTDAKLVRQGVLTATWYPARTS
jgi:hypothetical protein